MPILVKDFTWTQTSKTLHVMIPITQVFRENIDVFMFDSYVKIHFSPFLFEIFLLHDVENSKSKCLIKDDLITLDLVKKEEADWECLEKNLSKPEKMKIKQEVLERSQEQAKQEAEDKRIKKSQLDRFTVQQAMDIDSKQHDLMDKRRDNERKTAMDALEEWRVNNVDINTNAKRMIRPPSYPAIKDKHSGVKIVELSSSEDELEKNDAKKSVVKTANKRNEQNSGVTIVELSSSEDEKERKEVQKNVNKRNVPLKPVKTRVKSEYIEKKKQEVAKRVLPKLRQTAELEIKHTPRTFPTPSRESMANEEEAWLRNVTLARRATGFVSEDLRPEEQDPQWCKEKGDEFFRNGNFLGAISAYTHGIKLSDKLPSLFANRAATHFALGNFNKCLNDCSTALDLLKPACEANRHSRGKCIARRAAALVRLGYLNKAIDEMKAAVKLLPDDEKIKKDLYDMERAWEQNPDSD